MNNINYYNQNAKMYYESTKNANMEELYSHFLPWLDSKDIICDLGCGSGRDSLFFKNMGYKVVAIDGAKEMCKLASNLIGQEVICKKFEEINQKETYNAVWACASLLHVEKENMNDIFDKIHVSLKEDGIFYFSFKYGNSQREKDNRSFSDYTKEDIPNLLSDKFKLLESWISEDVRLGRENEKWLNVICMKK